MAETVRIEIPIETIDETAAGILSAVNGLNRMNQALQESRRQTEKARESVSKYDKSAEKTQKTLASWAKEKYEILLEAKDKVSPLLSTVRGGLKSIVSKPWMITMKAFDLVTSPVRGIINLLKNPMFQLGSMIGVSIGLADTINTYKEFESVMSQVEAVSGATGSEIEQLSEKAKEMGATTKFTAAEAGEAFNYMAMAGWKTGDMLDGIEGILNLAAASGGDLAETSDIVTDALTAFGLQAVDSAHFADVLAAASSNANTNVSMMGYTFKYAAPLAGALGYSIEDTAIAIGLMANAGIKSETAGTALRNIFSSLTGVVEVTGERFGKFVIDMEQTDGKMVPLRETLVSLREAFSQMTEAEKIANAESLVGKEAMSGLLAIVNAGEKDFLKLTNAIDHADGASERMAETMLQNLEGSIILLQSAVDGVKNSFGERLSPYVKGLVDWLTNQMPAVEQGLDEFMDWFDTKLDQMQKKFHAMTDTKEWKEADFFGKVKIAWDEMIAEPFIEWWNGVGKEKFAAFAQEIGAGIGTGLKLGIMTLLEIDIGETIDEGVSIGRSFAKGFSEGFDTKEVSGKVLSGFGQMLSSAGELLPGGEAPDISSILSAVMLGKMAKPLVQMGKGATKVGKMLFGSQDGGISLASSLLGSTGNAMVSGSGMLGKLANVGYGLTGGGTTAGMYFGNMAGAMSGGTAALIGAGSVVGGIAGAAGILHGGVDLYTGFTTDDEEKAKAYKKAGAIEVGGTLAGAGAGAATGAAIGAIFGGVGAVPGALIGAGIGAVGSWIAGNKVKEDYQKSAEEKQKEAKKAQKVFEATGFLIDEIQFANKELQGMMEDTEVSAEKLSMAFHEVVSKDLISHFGELHLSLTEVKEIANSIVFHDNKEEFEDFLAFSKKAADSLSAVKSTMADLRKRNWKMSLGFGVDQADIENYQEGIQSLVNGTKQYIEDKHYEANIAMKLLFGEEADMTALDTTQTISSQLEDLQARLSEEMANHTIMLEDGTLQFNQTEEILSLQQQIAEITAQVSHAAEEANFAALKIKYGGSELDYNSFASLQEELAAQVEEMQADAFEALKVNIKNLRLQLETGVIDESQYEEQLQKLTDAYNQQMLDLQVRVEQFQLEAIAEAYEKELVGILPDIEGTTAEKLGSAIALGMSQKDVADWTAGDMAGWLGIDEAELSAELNTLLQAVAKSIPSQLEQSMIDSFKDSSIDFIGPYSQEIYDQLALLDLSDADLESLKESLGSGIATAIEGADMQKVNEALAIIKGDVEEATEKIFGSGYSVTMPLHVMFDYNGSGSDFAAPSLNGRSTTVEKNAAGGYVSGGPQLSWLAEEGYGEFVIPTNPSRRSRALDLYQQAGIALGVSAHAAGGYIKGSIPRDTASDDSTFHHVNRNALLVYSEATEDKDNREVAQIYEPISTEEENRFSGIPSIQVNVNVAPEFVIQSNDDQKEEIILQVIRRHMKEMADELDGEIAERLEAVFSNMPLKGV